MLITEYTDRELELVNLVECGAPLWLPDVDNNAQMMGYLSDADILGYGGQAGGGKTDLALGKALNQHLVTIFFRDQAKEMEGLLERLTTIIGSTDGYNSQRGVWRLPKRNQRMEFGSLKDPGSERGYQGRPHDFIVYEEATNIRLNQVLFLMAWLRNTEAPGQKCEILMTFNPPSNAAGRWVCEFFSPWIETKSAEPGELRWFVTSDQKSIEVPDSSPCVIMKGEPVFDFDPSEFQLDDILKPRSRTFIPASVRENKYQGAAYLAVLQGLPEPLRSQMLEGDFTAGIQDDAMQIIPTEWVRAAMDRWKQTPVHQKPPMDVVGVDIAMGGRDNTIIARRHGTWFDVPVAYPGKETPDGETIMGLILAKMRDSAVVVLDAVGVGQSPLNFLQKAKFQVEGLNGGSKSNERALGGVMGFSNLKSELWWRFRELLDPANNRGCCLPPDEQLLKDLTAPIWEPDGPRIKAESRKAIIKRIGRSPDWGSAYVLAAREVPKVYGIIGESDKSGSYDPYAVLDQI